MCLGDIHLFGRFIQLGSLNYLGSVSYPPQYSFLEVRAFQDNWLGYVFSEEHLRTQTGRGETEERARAETRVTRKEGTKGMEK